MNMGLNFVPRWKLREYWAYIFCECQNCMNIQQSALCILGSAILNYCVIYGENSFQYLKRLDKT